MLYWLIYDKINYDKKVTFLVMIRSIWRQINIKWHQIDIILTFCSPWEANQSLNDWSWLNCARERLVFRVSLIAAASRTSRRDKRSRARSRANSDLNAKNPRRKLRSARSPSWSPHGDFNADIFVTLIEIRSGSLVYPYAWLIEYRTIEEDSERERKWESTNIIHDSCKIIRKDWSSLPQSDIE